MYASKQLCHLVLCFNLRISSLGRDTASIHAMRPPESGCSSDVDILIPWHKAETPLHVGLRHGVCVYQMNISFPKGQQFLTGCGRLPSAYKRMTTYRRNTILRTRHEIRNLPRYVL
jgi:hypothetical protein